MFFADDPEHYAASCLERALVGTGNTFRLESLFRKASAGKAVTIAFLGGSITQGCNASSSEHRYVDRVIRWFRASFPGSPVTCVNAGVGATTSLVGAHRAQSQVLSHEPDLVIVDFAVNDREQQAYREAYESLVRDLLSAPSRPAVLELFMMIEGGINEQAVETEIGLHYGLPMISYRNLVQGMIRDGNAEWKDVATDEVHPNDLGHGLCAGLVIAFLERVRARLKSPRNEISSDDALPEPVYSDRFCGGSILNADTLCPEKIGGFTVCEESFQVFPRGWTLSRGGSDANASGAETIGTLSVTIEARNIVLLFLKSVSAGSGTITIRTIPPEREVKMQDRSGEPLTVDTFFKDGWGDYAETAEIARNETKRSLRLELTAHGPVTILGFMVS